MYGTQVLYLVCIRCDSVTQSYMCMYLRTHMPAVGIFCYLHMYTQCICIHHTYIHTVHTYIHTYIHTYVRTYIHTYIHTYIYTHIHTYIHTYIYTYCTYIHTYIHSYLCTYVFIGICLVASIEHCYTYTYTMVHFVQTLKEMSTGVSKLNEQAQALKSAILKLTKEKVSVHPPSSSLHLLQYPSVYVHSLSLSLSLEGILK